MKNKLHLFSSRRW